MSSSQISSTQKKLKARRAFIADESEENSKNLKRKTSGDKTKDIILSLEGNKEHLETKKQIEDLRKQYGDSWLHSQGASAKVHDVIGIPSPLPDPDGVNYFKSAPPDTTEQLIENFFGSDSSFNNDNRTSTPVNKSKVGVSSHRQLQLEVSWNLYVGQDSTLDP